MKMIYGAHLRRIVHTICLSPLIVPSTLLKLFLLDIVSMNYKMGDIHFLSQHRGSALFTTILETLETNLLMCVLESATIVGT